MLPEEVDKMSLQEACDFVVSKLIQQGGACTNGHDCKYGNDKGSHCAVGWLLDENNEELMEFSGNVRAMIIEIPELLPNLIKNNLSFFHEFQLFHDRKVYNETYSITDLYELKRRIDLTKDDYRTWISMGD